MLPLDDDAPPPRFASAPENSTRVVLVPVTEATRATLENLAQLYIHDWSAIVPLDVGEDGRFHQLDLTPYRDGNEHHALLVRVEDRPAGFALIHEASRLTGERGVFDMAEFFVLRRYRRQGVGLAAAFAAFDRFPGPWEIRQRDDNPDATAFWRRAVAQYTGGAYREARWESPAWTGPVQTFSSRR
ncbi:MAG TPA: GNAT family N-acetyltransferase [Polyangiaceae bacterium]|jgi:predicted acetyltransferase|nr:GNAT family N-acetyltransferase [Polyangiaceae bacterium]